MLVCAFGFFLCHAQPAHHHAHHRRHHVAAAAPVHRAEPKAPDSVDVHFRGTASFYGPGFDGRRTACGTHFSRWALTAAHRTLPCGTIVQVVNLANGKSVDLTIDDRGPYVAGRIIDVSEAAAQMLGFHEAGTAMVDIQPLNWGPR